MTKSSVATRPQPARRKVLATLHATGPISDKSGRATSLLATAMGYAGRPASLSPLLSVLEQDDLVRREVRGRRCFLVELTAKGRAMVELDASMDTRHIGVVDRAHPRLGIAAAADAGSYSALSTASGAYGDPLELMRRELRDLLMEVGVLRHRVAELERRLDAVSD